MAKVLTFSSGIPRLIDEASTYTYEATYVVSSTISASTPIDLPDSETYDSSELSMYLNGLALEVTGDYDYVGTSPRTQITMTFDLVAGDRLKFRKEKNI